MTFFYRFARDGLDMIRSKIRQKLMRETDDRAVSPVTYTQ